MPKCLRSTELSVGKLISMVREMKQKGIGGGVPRTPADRALSQFDIDRLMAGIDKHIPGGESLFEFVMGQYFLMVGESGRPSSARFSVLQSLLQLAIDLAGSHPEIQKMLEEERAAEDGDAADESKLAAVAPFAAALKAQSG